MSQNTRTVVIDTPDGRYQLQINPKDIAVSQDSKNKTIDLLNVGEINVLGNRGLIKTTITTWLPGPDSPFYKGTDPWDIVAALKKAKNGKKTVRLIITGTDVNTLFAVSAMSETYKEGQQDIYVSWAFTEYRNLDTASVASYTKRYTDTGICERETRPEVPKTLVVKRGDTLWYICRRYYGDGSRWKELAKANGMEGDEDMRPGKVLVMLPC